MALINPRNKFLATIISIFLFIVIRTTVEHFNNRKIEQNGGYNTVVIAIITSKSNYNKNRNTIHFKYHFKNIEFKTFTKNLSDEDYQMLSIGDDIRVFINDKYPTYTKLNL